MHSSNSIYFCINLAEGLRAKLAKEYNLLFSELRLITFPDGEFFAQPKLSVRGKKTFIFHSLSYPVNDNLMKLLVTIDAIKRSSAEEINLIITYLAYARQDRKTEERAAITSKLIANLISCSGADKITTLDLHTDQIEGFFDITIDHLYSMPLFAEYLINRYGLELREFVIVSPDFGATKRARVLSNLLSIPIVIMEKIRNRERVIDEHNVYGEVGFKRCLIVDDIIGTGGTVIQALKTLKKLGAKSITICATHALFCGNAWSLFEKAYSEDLFTEVIVTDSVPLQKEFKFLKVVSIAKLLAKIVEIYDRGQGSISSIYETWNREILQKVGKI